MTEVISAYIDTKEAAHFLGLAKATLEKFRCEGGGPGYRKLSRRVLYKRADLEAWMESHARSNTSE